MVNNTRETGEGEGAPNITELGGRICDLINDAGIPTDARDMDAVYTLLCGLAWRHGAFSHD